MRDWLAEDDYRLHEGSGDAATDGKEVGGGGEDLDERGLPEVGEINLHSVAEAASELIVHGDRGHLRQKGAWMGKKSFEFVGGGGLELVDGGGVIESEGSGPGAAEGGEMGSASSELAKLMGDGADVAAGGDGDGEGGGVVVK